MRQQLRPAIEPKWNRWPIEYDRLGRRVEAKQIPFWMGAACVAWMWIAASVVL